MSYSVRVVVEGDDIEDTTWVLDNFEDEDEAIEYAEQVLARSYSATGIEPMRLDQ